MHKFKTQQKGFVTLGVIALIVAGTLIGGYITNKFFSSSNNNVAGTFQTPDVRALFETSLASRITSTATSFTLTSATDKDGNSIASSTYGFIIDEGTSVEEFVLADCTGTTCTNATRGLSARTGTTTVAALEFAHNRGASVKITDAPSLIFAINVFKGRQNIENPLVYNSSVSISSTTDTLASARFVMGAANQASTTVDARITTLDALNAHLAGTEIFTGSKTFTPSVVFTAGFTANGTSTLTNGALVSTAYRCTTNSSDNQLCEKKYIDAQVSAGASNANNTTAGLVQMAWPNQAAAGTSLGSTGARLALGSDIATSTSQVATSSVVMTLPATGKIDPSFLSGTENYILNGSTRFNGSIIASSTNSLATTTVNNLNVTDLGKNVQVITSTGKQTFTKPAGVTKIKITMVGGGGAGGAATDITSTAGTAGATLIKWYDATATTSMDFFVGTGGPSATNNGGDTTMPALSLVAGKGLGGANTCTTPQAGGAATGGDINIDGGASDGCFNFTGGQGNMVGRGGNSQFGQGGSAGTEVNVAIAATGYGSGGQSSGIASVAGKQGIVIIEW